MSEAYETPIEKADRIAREITDKFSHQFQIALANGDSGCTTMIRVEELSTGKMLPFGQTFIVHGVVERLNKYINERYASQYKVTIHNTLDTYKYPTGVFTIALSPIKPDKDTVT